MPKLHRLFIAALFIAALAALGSSTAQASVVGCDDQSTIGPGSDSDDAPGESSADASGDRTSRGALVYGSDSVDIITINPKVAFGFHDEGKAETEGEGTSASSGESGAMREDNDDGSDKGCLLRTHDAVDVLTINPEVSASIDDSPLLFDDDQDRGPNDGNAPGPASQR